jgi:hypothetical protein
MPLPRIRLPVVGKTLGAVDAIDAPGRRIRRPCAKVVLPDPRTMEEPMPSTSPVRSLTRAAVGIAVNLTGLVLLAAPSAAQAQELAPPTAATSGPSGGSAATSPAAAAASFGVAGAWVVSVQSFNAGSATPSFFFDKQASGGSRLLIQPGLDYFIGNGISVGGVVGFGYTSGSPATTTVTLGARAGFNQGLNQHVSFWPTIGIDGSYSHNATSNSTAALEVFAPFLYHAAPHFFLGAGPFLSYLVKGGPDTEYGLDFVIGGWL